MIAIYDFARLKRDSPQFNTEVAVMSTSAKRLTASRINELKFQQGEPKKQITYDAQLAGFGVRVYPSGRKAYVLQYGRRAYRRLMVLAPCTTGHDVNAVREVAQTLLRKHRTDRIDPLNEQKRVAAATVSAIVTEYIDQKGSKWADTEQERCQARLNNHIAPHIGSIPLDKLTRAQVQEAHIAISKTVPYQANRSIQLLRASINFALSHRGWRVTNFVDGENPATRIELNKEKSRKEWIKPEEIPQLITAIRQEVNPWMAGFFLMVLYTGARKSELLNLQWTDVDFKQRLIRFWDTKNHEDHEVPLSQDAIKLLQSIPHTLGNAYVFCGHVKGRPINNPYKPWKRILKRANIDRRVTIHDLRRTVGSLLATSGYSTQQIGKLLNHKSSITAKVYAEIADSAKVKMTDAIAQILK